MNKTAFYTKTKSAAVLLVQDKGQSAEKHKRINPGVEVKVAIDKTNC